jgi:hypothetical protein
MLTPTTSVLFNQALHTLAQARSSKLFVWTESNFAMGNSLGTLPASYFFLA